ncbi:MAG: type I methionyl aminopeptidase [Candidatus Cloacimonadales bacterium]
MIVIKNEQEIEKMRAAGKLAAQLLDFLEPQVRAGNSTAHLDRLAEKFTVEQGAISAPLNYHGFPKSICTSINNVVCHGIPSEQDILQDGDIVNIDVTVILDKYHGDSSRTYLIGQVDPEIAKLVERTRQALEIGIAQIQPGGKLNAVGRAIENYIKPFGYAIVDAYCGHGIGRSFHEAPHVLHTYSLENNIELQPGMTFTVEPMINLGKSSEVKTSAEDGWTVTTADGSVSAQFEHTVLVTETGVEILTQS